MFPSNDGKDVAYGGRNGRKGGYFPPESVSFVFVINLIQVLFPTCNSTWRVNNYVSGKGDSINKKNKCTKNIIKKILYCTVQQILRTSKNQKLLLLEDLLLLKTNLLEHCYSQFDEQKNSVFTTVEFFPSSKIIATIKKRKLAAMARETQEYPSNNQSENSAAPGITEDYIAQVSEEIEGKVAK